MKDPAEEPLTSDKKKASVRKRQDSDRENLKLQIPENAVPAPPPKKNEWEMMDDEEEQSSDIDEGWAWVVLLGAFLAFSVLSGLFSTFTYYYSELLDAFGKSKSTTAWVGSTYTAVFFLGGPMATFVILKWGCRVTIMAGGVLAACGFILASFCNSIETMIFAQGIVTAMGLSLNFAGWVIALSLYFQDKHSLGTGLAMTGFGVGLFFLGPAMEASIKFYTWRGSLIINAGLALQFCVFGALVFPVTLEQQEIHERKMEMYELERMGRDPEGGATPQIYVEGQGEKGNFKEYSPRTPTTPTMYSPLASFLSHSVRSISEASKSGYSSHFSSRRPSVSSFLSLPGSKGITRSLENLDVNSDEFRIRSNSMVDRPMRRHTVSTTSKEAAIKAQQESGDPKGDGSGSRLRKKLTPSKLSNLLEVPKVSYFSQIEESNEDDDHEEHAGNKNALTVPGQEDSNKKEEERSATFHLRTSSFGSENEFHQGKDVELQEIHKDGEIKAEERGSMDLSRELEEEQPEPKDIDVFLQVCWDPSLFKDIRLWCFSLSGFAWMFGTFTMTLSYKDIADNMGIQKRFIYAMSGIGLGDLFGRLFAATISSWSWINNVFYYGLSQLICGIVILQHENITTAEGLIIMGVLLGASYGQQNVLLAIAPAQVYGPQKLTTLFGYILLFCGLGVLSGPPIAGTLVDLDPANSYSKVYLMAGISTLIGSFLTFVCFFIDNKRLQRKIRELITKLRAK